MTRAENRLPNGAYTQAGGESTKPKTAKATEHNSPTAMARQLMNTPELKKEHRSKDKTERYQSKSNSLMET